ncbi:glycosyltransferase family 39 protein [Halorubrum yunnanense]|uniref:Glycosyltransferase family 39 protein n=1 Tax=Halorubrum yunnanense TaxID=1526162 RepID=A0ABD5YD98_9EURY|nr:glycosyltransferase family 39 protein [Halorubrum yunnanense]
MSPPSALRRFRRLARRSARRLASRGRARIARADRLTLAAALVAVAAGVFTFAVAATLFRYHSVNHDEGVYLTQAALLLSGQLEFHAGALADAVHPWFFVEDDGRLYPKYNPVPAAMYAVSLALFGEPRVTLAVVAAGNATLVYLLGLTVFDRRVGLAAAVCFAASPMALVTSAVFLPYAPTTFLNLLFAVAYLRGVRDRSLPLAGLAGVAIGLAFFARPFTAVLFAAPFILHALGRVVVAVRDAGVPPFPLPAPVRRHGLTALLGIFFVAVTLAYNLRLTGAPLTFPYEAFAPMDGPGFGERRILGHSEEYTVELALRSNGYALWYLVTRWVVAGPLGALLALAGGGLAAGRWLSGRRAFGVRDGGDDRDDAAGRRFERTAGRRFERTAGLLLGGVVVSVVVGNLFFWGTNNLLGTLSDPTDGLVAGFGPFYHFDLLVPLSLFGGVAVAAGGRGLSRLRDGLSSRVTPDTARAVVVAVAALAILGGALGAAAAAEAPLDRHSAHADKYETAYEPIESAQFDDDLVFVPTPYGEWLNHPFQVFRNEPGLDGPVVYALDRDPAEDFAVIDTYPDRDLRRYAYRGVWTPDPNRRVTPKLESLAVREGERVDAATTVGVPARVQRAVVRLETTRGEPVGGAETVRAEYDVRDPDGSLAVGWSLTPDGARLDGAPNATVPIDPAGDEVIVTVTLVDAAGSTFTYRQEATVREPDGSVEVVWPPERSVCRLVTECGTEGTYIPGDSGVHPEWVAFETNAEANDLTE